MDVLHNLLYKISYYPSQIGQYSVANSPLQIVFAVCPALFRYITKDGVILFSVLTALSLIHYRFFHIFFVLVILATPLPSEHDKKFWGAVGFYMVVLFLWGYLDFLMAMNWVGVEH